MELENLIDRGNVIDRNGRDSRMTPTPGLQIKLRHRVNKSGYLYPAPESWTSQWRRAVEKRCVFSARLKALSDRSDDLDLWRPLEPRTWSFHNRFPVDYLCQSAATSDRSFSNDLVHKFDGRTNKRTTTVDWRRHNNKHERFLRLIFAARCYA